MKILKWADGYLEEYASCILLAIISIVMMAQIIMRYAFENAFFWAEELSRYCYIWMVFLSAGFCIKKDNELRVSIIVEHLPRIPRGILQITSEVVIVVFYAIMTYHSYFVVMGLHATMRQSPALGIPMYIMYSSCLIGFSLGVLRGLQKLYVKRKIWFAKNPALIEVKSKTSEPKEIGGE